jgi:hypothetical protein
MIGDRLNGSMVENVTIMDNGEVALELAWYELVVYLPGDNVEVMR